MRCPELSELPPPPPGKTGWPWTEESPPLPDTMPDGQPWPRVSIVTPSYNQGQFIEETIRSVLLQGYPDLEYIVIDGGSTDNSVEIIRKYAPWLTYWVSEPDRGQAHAINKGWKRAKGDILAYLNSDDIYTPGSIAHAARAFTTNPDAALVHGSCEYVDADGSTLEVHEARSCGLATLLKGCCILQPSAFIRSEVLRDIGLLDESLHFVMDLELWMRICLRYPTVHLSGIILSRHRRHKDAKSLNWDLQWREELTRVFDAFCSCPEVEANFCMPCHYARARSRFGLAIAAIQVHRPAYALQSLWDSFCIWPLYVFRRPLDTLYLLKEIAKAVLYNISKRVSK